MRSERTVVTYSRFTSGVTVWPINKSGQADMQTTSNKNLVALNKQAGTAAIAYMGKVAWPTVLLIVSVWVLLGLSLALFHYGFLPVWAATLCVAGLTYFSYTPLHEAVHGNLHGNKAGLRWLNDLCGYMAAPIIAIPYASHRHEHFTHHRYTNIPEKDPDYMISAMGRGLASLLPTTVKFFYNQNAYFAKHHWQSASNRERLIYCAELVFSAAWRIGVILWISTPGVLVVFLLGYFLGGFFTAYWFAYRPHIPYQNTKRYQTTNSLIMPKWMRPIEWFWLGQNLHSIHHLFPRVPFYRYHALHREIEPVLRAHGTPIVDIWSQSPVSTKP